MTLTEFMNERYKNREDKDNIFGVGISDAEFRHFIINYLLGEDWYVVDPLGQTQVNEIALNTILKKYSKQYRKEYKNRKKEKENSDKIKRKICERAAQSGICNRNCDTCAFNVLNY